MSVRRSKNQIDRLKKARSKRAGVAKARSRMVLPATRWAKRNASAGRIVGSHKVTGSGKRSPQTRSQPRPKLPLLSGGKDPTLAERFEEELYRS